MVFLGKFYRRKHYLRQVCVVCCLHEKKTFFLPSFISTPSGHSDSVLLEPQSRFGGKSLGIRLVCPQIGTGVLKVLQTVRQKKPETDKRKKKTPVSKAS